MQGKILAQGLISGNDGDRYHFKDGDIKNMPENSSMEAIIGAEVDFECVGTNAKDIYIINKEPLSLENTKQKPLSDDVKGIKAKAYGMMVCYALSVIPILGVLLGIIAFVLNILVILAVKKASQSTTIFRNFILQIAVYIVGGIIMTFGVFADIGFWEMAGRYDDVFTAMTAMSISVVVIGLLVLLSSLYFTFAVTKELAFVTNQPYFMYAFWCFLAGFLTMVIFVGFLVLIASFIFYIMAWVKTNEIRKSYSAIS